MAKKMYDIAIKVGEYEKDGQKKGRYKNLGAIFEGENGPYALIDATCVSMQLFALANKDRRDSLICSLFEPKDVTQRPTGSKAPSESGIPPDDDIPF